MLESTLIEKVGTALIGYGLPGLIMLVEGMALYWIFGKYEDESKGRREDALTAQKAFAENTVAIRQMADELDAVKTTIGAMADAQRNTSNEIRLLATVGRPRQRDSSAG